MEMDKDAIQQAEFALAKGDRLSDRLTDTCLKQIASLLDGKAISIDGKLCRIKFLCAPGVNDAGEMRILFDVKKPHDELSHIEFKIIKSGFEMDLTGGMPVDGDLTGVIL